mmetsp:Transcript_10127/g.22045  ORF Transcript_10127/g.22045 Transcript_10127/m.22045 type:complete len:138 (-) Transcript_10127:1937-2350(-)
MDSSGEKEIATLTASHVEQGAVGNPVVGDMENKGHSMESDEEKMQVDQERPDKKSENETGDSNEVGNEVMAQNGVDSVEGTGVPGLGEKTTDTSSVAEGEKEKKPRGRKNNVYKPFRKRRIFRKCRTNSTDVISNYR